MKRLLPTALVLVLALLCASCKSAAEREAHEQQEKQKEEVRKAVNSLLEDRFANLTSEDQARWQMREVRLFGPYRFYGLIGNWDVKDDPAAVEGIVWYEGTDLDG